MTQKERIKKTKFNTVCVFSCKQTALKIEDGDEQLSSIKDTSGIRYDCSFHKSVSVFFVSFVLTPK